MITTGMAFLHRSGFLSSFFASRRLPAFWPALVGAPAVVLGNLIWLLGATLPGLIVALAGFGACAAGLVRLRYLDTVHFFGPVTGGRAGDPAEAHGGSTGPTHRANPGSAIAAAAGANGRLREVPDLWPSSQTVRSGA